MNRLFDSLGYEYAPDFARFENLPAAAKGKNQHEVRLDLKDAGKELVLTADVPGVELNDMTLAVTPHYVCLSGDRKSEKGEHDEQHYRMERTHGFFRRVVPLPCEIDRNGVDAVYKDGVLRITLPKANEAVVDEKKVNIKAG
jgi:HSP20 family protein